MIAAALAAAPAAAFAQPAHTVRVMVDAANPGETLPDEIFGINSPWLDAGGGLVEFGEMIRDRSFRNQDKPAARAWIESPGAESRGRIRHVAAGGHDRPWGGKPGPGYMALSQDAPGYTCISQQVTEGMAAGGRYELHVSAKAEGGAAAIVAFFADAKYLPVEKADRLVSVAPGDWADYPMVLEPGRTDAFAMLRLCLVSRGSVALDEVRLSRLGSAPRVKDFVRGRIAALGVRSLRWPAGSDADHFAWRESIGPTRDRGENVSAFGPWQTPAWGLHEFLDFCESARIVPLITVNVREPARSAADLFEYIVGPATTPMGTLRVKHGRAAPWDVRHFELGNEPAEIYLGERPKPELGRAYVALARPVAEAMRAKAEGLGRPLLLKGSVETTFASADWIAKVPMLANWNRAVLGHDAGLVKRVDHVHGHFYSAFAWRESDREQFEEVMAGGSTLAANVRRLRKDFAPLPPFWLTEYSVLIEKKRFLRGAEIQIDRSKDFQAGLAAADLLLTAIEEGYGGAYLWNLAEFGTWGVLANPVDYRFRPAGQAFSMIAKLAGARRLRSEVSGARSVTVKGADGNNPANMRYTTVAATAARSGDTVHVVLLNRSFDNAEKVWIELRGAPRERAIVERLGPADTRATNDQAADTVRIVASELGADAAHVVELAPRSLVRVSYVRP